MQNLHLCYLMQCIDFCQSCELLESRTTSSISKQGVTHREDPLFHAFTQKCSLEMNEMINLASPFILPFLPHPAAWYPIVLGSLRHQPLWSTTGSHTNACSIPGANVLWLCFYSPLNIFHLLLLLSHKNTLNQCFYRTFYNNLQVNFLSSRTKMIILSCNAQHSTSPVFCVFFWPHCEAAPGTEPGLSAVKVWSPNDWTAREFPSPLHHFEISIWDPLIPPGKLSG